MPLNRKKIFKMKDKADTRKQNRRENSFYPLGW